MTIKLFYFLLFIFFYYQGFPQQKSENTSFLFYNVENLFDTYNDSTTNDVEFTPDGDRHWSTNRLNQKCLNISKVILNSSGGWHTPVIVGLCEIENRKVVEWLLNKTPLKTLSYKIIHKESPDHRGIEIALLYNEKRFYPLNYSFFPLKDKNDSILPTREISYVRGILDKQDTIHLFLNHWPSRYSGLLETRSQRNIAAELLRHKVDELFLKKTDVKIIIMGDFNDQPDDESIWKILGAGGLTDSIILNQLYNLSSQWKDDNSGTLKYQSQWNIFDQVIVSGSLLKKKHGYYAHSKSASIVNLPFLLEKDEKFGGFKPKRTYIGFNYNGGFSDHLPIILRLEKFK